MSTLLNRYAAFFAVAAFFLNQTVVVYADDPCWHIETKPQTTAKSGQCSGTPPNCDGTIYALRFPDDHVCTSGYPGRLTCNHDTAQAAAYVDAYVCVADPQSGTKAAEDAAIAVVATVLNAAGSKHLSPQDLQDAIKSVTSQNDQRIDQSSTCVQSASCASDYTGEADYKNETATGSYCGCPMLHR